MSSIVETWNEFIDHLQKAKDVWEKHQGLALSGAGESLDPSVPFEGLRHLSMGFNRASFDVALPRIADYWRRSGGLQAMKINSVVSNIETQEKKKRR